MILDSFDLTILGSVLVATLAYFTYGSLWGSPKQDDSDATKSFTSSLSSSNNNRNIADEIAQSGKDFVIFFGSQTGTAEDYASRLAKEASSKFGLKSMKLDPENYDFESISTIDRSMVLGFVLATYGEGEPTDNAAEFYDFLMSPDSEFEAAENPSKPFAGINYVIFGLGSSTYEYYNQVGKKVDHRLRELGAIRIGPHGEGDDGNATTEEDYINWKDTMFDEWKALKGLEERETVYEPAFELVEESLTETQIASQVYLGEHTTKKPTEGQGPYDATNPYAASIVQARELFTNTDRHCIHMELDLADSGLRYRTGDHVAVWPQNSNAEVHRFLTIFGLASKEDTVFSLSKLDPMASVPFKSPTTYGTAIRYYLEINGPVSRQFLSSVAAFAPSIDAKTEALRLGSDKAVFQREVASVNYNTALILEKISNGQPWNQVPFTFIVETFPKLQPRYYSISSSSMAQASVLSITAVVESSPRATTAANALPDFKGVTTNYILDLKEKFANSSSPAAYQIDGPRGKYGGTRIPVHIRKSSFKLPSDPKKPIIMVGPGTGIAPFRGFIYERSACAQAGQTIGRALLFAGCRLPTEDNLYAEELKQFSESRSPDEPLKSTNFLTVINAFSRQTATKVYVQHKMVENASLISSLIDQGAAFYVCGDASHMAKEVHSALCKVLSDERKISLSNAESFVKSLKTRNLYQEDVW